MLTVFPVSRSLCLCFLAVRWLRKTPHAALTKQWTRHSSTDAATFSPHGKLGCQVWQGKLPVNIGGAPVQGPYEELTDLSFEKSSPTLSSSHPPQFPFRSHSTKSS